MADVNILSWNIETLGPRRYIYKAVRSPRADPLFKIIVDTVNLYDITILSIIELATSVDQHVATDIMQRLNTSVLGLNPWGFEIVITPYDSYCLFYRNDQGFDICRDGTGATVKGYDDTRVPPGSPNRLPFPKAGTPSGGRRPCYVAFETTDRGAANEVLFTVIAYHANYGSKSCIGIRKIPLMDAIQSVTFNGNAHPVSYSFISGDFNCDRSLNAQDYARALILGHEAVTPANTTHPQPPHVPNPDAAKTSLGHHVNSTDPLNFRAHAYDNIFSRNAPGVAPMTTGLSGVAPMITDFTQNGNLSDAPAYCDVSFRHAAGLGRLGNGPGQLPQGIWNNWNGVAGIPGIQWTPGFPPAPPAPQNIDDGFVAYINGVSNHLPVYAYFVV